MARVTTADVFVFWPNLIGYSRVILAAAACALMRTHPVACMWTYIVSCLLDAADGHVARYMNQCSRFGAVLDMVTDRSTTTCLLAYLTTVYPEYLLVFQLLMALDLSSHYMHMYASLVGGHASHKEIDRTANPILRLYYHNKIVLFLVCAFNELEFVLLYALYHVPTTSAYYAAIYYGAWVAFPVCALKQVLNVVQLVGASKKLAELDAQTANAAVKTE
ncbi:CDP-diacylglycerol-inositol 3-phosphatidyltransferase [Allomyces javanicus]|nr:CDP-diacylglycerol-inositol 3-phosphatidyltransferase [Allomyces javanicus]